MSVKKALIYFLENRDKRPIVRPIADVGVDTFKKDIEVLSNWLESQAIAFFASTLGLATEISANDPSSPNRATKIAAKMYEKLCDFAEVPQLYEGENPSKKISRVFPEFGKAKLEKVLDPDVKEERFQWTNKREMLFLICMALEINKEDNQNVKRLFNLLGLTYARMAEPSDILYAWAVELKYSYKQFCDLKEFIENLTVKTRMGNDVKLNLSTQHKADVRALEKGVSTTIYGVTLDGDIPPHPTKEIYNAYLQTVVNPKRAKDGKMKQADLSDKQVIAVNKNFHKMLLDLDSKTHNTGPLSYEHTAQMEQDVRALLENADEAGLRRYMEKHRYDFHLCSITRAIIFDDLLELRFGGDDEGFGEYDEASIAKYNDYINGKKEVTRNDIIDVCCDLGYSLTKIDRVLKEANFALINPKYEIKGRELEEFEIAGIVRT